MNTLIPYFNCTGRLLIAAIFLLSGLSKIAGYAATQSYMDSMGVPGTLLPLVIIFEISAALAVIIGWQTRLFAFLLAGFCLLSAVIFHGNLSDRIQFIMFMKNLAIAGGFMFLVANGPGPLSLDSRRRWALSGHPRLRCR